MTPEPTLLGTALAWGAAAIVILAAVWGAYTAYRDGLLTAPVDPAEVWARRLVMDAERDGDAWDAGRDVHIVAPTLTRPGFLIHHAGEKFTRTRLDTLESLAAHYRRESAQRVTT